MGIASWIWLGLFLVGAALFVFYTRIGKFFRCLIFTAFTGVGSLGLLWLVGLAIPVPVAITPLSIAVSGLLGIPGVLGMLVLHLI